MPDTFTSTPPGHHAGDTSHRTIRLRPDLGLAEEVVAAIRRERKKGQEPAQIAATLSLPVAAVDRALLALRTPRPERTRATLNVTREAAALVHREKQGDEPLWQTMDRLLDELRKRREGGYE
ncbi:hypothetical protein [Roseomonas sp. BN140053]|uniref:hypothetical protein n=1 Tax=Roseomonas sp. BN140053 TaxID=3391898 RepID=UPI0039EBA73E